MHLLQISLEPPKSPEVVLEQNKIIMRTSVNPSFKFTMLKWDLRGSILHDGLAKSSKILSDTFKVVEN